MIPRTVVDGISVIPDVAMIFDPVAFVELFGDVLERAGRVTGVGESVSVTIRVFQHGELLDGGVWDLVVGGSRRTGVTGSLSNGVWVFGGVDGGGVYVTGDNGFNDEGSINEGFMEFKTGVKDVWDSIDEELDDEDDTDSEERDGSDTESNDSLDDRNSRTGHRQWLQVSIQDSGPGIPDSILHDPQSIITSGMSVSDHGINSSESERDTTTTSLLEFINLSKRRLGLLHGAMVLETVRGFSSSPSSSASDSQDRATSPLGTRITFTIPMLVYQGGHDQNPPDGFNDNIDDIDQTRRGSGSSQGSSNGYGTVGGGGSDGVWESVRYQGGGGLRQGTLSRGILLAVNDVISRAILTRILRDLLPYHIIDAVGNTIEALSRVESSYLPRTTTTQPPNPDINTITPTVLYEIIFIDRDMVTVNGVSALTCIRNLGYDGKVVGLSSSDGDRDEGGVSYRDRHSAVDNSDGYNATVYRPFVEDDIEVVLNRFGIG
ncbi:hypothetical protein HDU76_007674 [Blyttiomyces sp. JEL0837]|nr:hypothetical protein HDU76_007674 [Blyttiomyces sp. JEL0837]